MFRRDEAGWWIASVPSLQGCHTQGRTIDQARRRVREAIGLYLENPDEVAFNEEIHLPSRADGGRVPKKAPARPKRTAKRSRR